MIRDNGINYRESLSSIELNNIYNNKYRRNIPLVLYKRGGKIPHVFDGRTERRQRMVIREHDTPADNMRTDNIGIPLGYYPEVQPILPESLYEAADNAGITLVPLLGDAIDGLEALNQASKGNYGTAAITAGSLLLPNIIEKPVKKVVKAVAKPVAERIDNLLRRIKGDKYDNLMVKEGDYYTNTSLLDAYNGVNKDIYLSDEDKYMIEQLAQNGVDISKYNMHALEALSKARRESLLSDGRRFVLDRSIDPNLRIMYLFGDNQTKPLGYITYSDDLGEGKYSIGYVENVTLKRRGVIPSKGVSESLYNGAIQDIRSMGGEGIKTGELLASPEATSKVWEHYPNKIQLSEEGIWRRTDPDTLQFIYEGGHPVYLLDEPSYEIPLKSLYFDPNIIDDEGNLSVDWNGDKYHSKGGKLLSWNKLSMRDRHNAIHKVVLDTFANGGSLTDISLKNIRHIYDGESENNLQLNNLMKAPLDLLTPKYFSAPYLRLRYRSFGNRRESDNVLDFRGTNLKGWDEFNELPALFYLHIEEKYIPEFLQLDIPLWLKTDRMKRIDALNKKYNTQIGYFAQGGATSDPYDLEGVDVTPLNNGVRISPYAQELESESTVLPPQPIPDVSPQAPLSTPYTLPEKNKEIRHTVRRPPREHRAPQPVLLGTPYVEHRLLQDLEIDPLYNNQLFRNWYNWYYNSNNIDKENKRLIDDQYSQWKFHQENPAYDLYLWISRDPHWSSYFTELYKDKYPAWLDLKTYDDYLHYLQEYGVEQYGGDKPLLPSDYDERIAFLTLNYNIKQDGAFDYLKSILKPYVQDYINRLKRSKPDLDENLIWDRFNNIPINLRKAEYYAGKNGHIFNVGASYNPDNTISFVGYDPEGKEGTDPITNTEYGEGQLGYFLKTLMHEYGHAFRDLFPYEERYSKDDLKIYHKAYPKLVNVFNMPSEEEGFQTNLELRTRIGLGANLTGEALNDYIRNMSYEDLIEAMRKSGYTHNLVGSYMNQWDNQLKLNEKEKELYDLLKQQVEEYDQAWRNAKDEKKADALYQKYWELQHLLWDFEDSHESTMYNEEMLDNVKNALILLANQDTNTQRSNNNITAYGGPLELPAFMPKKYGDGGNKEEEEEVNTNNYSVGNLVDALYRNNPREKYLGEPEHHYDFTQSEEWANAHGYYPDARGHRDDRVKKPAHPSHPSRGRWDGDKFILTDLGMQNPNYTLFGLVDGNQDPQATLVYNNGVVLPEITVTPKGNLFYNPYDNIELHYAKGGKIYIKPENRGKFTALKKRTGHSASWFKAHGTPAQKKMATFALNARKWKHGDGGRLFGEGGNEDDQPLFVESPVEAEYPKNGGSPDMTWHKWWLYNRADKIGRNIKDTESHPIWAFQELTGINFPGFEAIGKERIPKLLDNASKYTEYIGGWKEIPDEIWKSWRGSFPRQLSMSDEDFDALSRVGNVTGHTDNYMKYVYYPNPTEGTVPHERAHILWARPMERKIDDYNFRKRVKKGVDNDYYYDGAREIYARLMAFRNRYNLNPKHKVTKEDLEVLRNLENSEESGSRSYLFDRYNDDFLLYLFNEVAHNGSLQDFREQFANQAAFGGPIVKAANKHLYDEGGNKESKYTPIIYIGGTPQQAREKYWQEYPRMGEVVDSIANVYGIDPVLIKNNLNHEGFVDRRIDENNWLLEEGVDYDKRGLVDDFLSGKDNDEYNTHGFSEYGFDNGVGAPIIHNEVTLPSHITYDISPEDNELGERVMSISGKTPQDNIEITAVMLKRLSDKIKLDYPNLSEYDHNRYVRAFWNRGIANGKRWVKNGAKGYNYKNGGHLFDGESEDTNAFQSIYKAPDDILTPRTFSAPYELLRRRMFNRRESDNVIDLRQKRYDFSELMNELPTIIFPIDDFVPEALKSDRMKYIDYLNNKYALKGKRKIKYGDAFYDFLEKRKARHHYDGESEDTQYLNDTKGFYNFDREKGIIQLPWNTPLRQRMADRREADVIDLRLNRPTFTDWVKELPASFISDFTASDDYVPEILKTARMKYIDYLNSKYNLLGEKRIRYNDAPDAQRERGRRPWTKEVGFDRKFNIGGNLLGEGGLEQDELSIGNIGFFNHPLLSLKYYGSPLYDLETPFTVAFTDAIIKDKDAFMWNGKMYSTDIDWNKKFEKDANGNIPFQEFANYMYPAVIKILKEKGLPLTNAHNIVRLAGLESLYGTNPVSGKGYNLSGIKWNPKTMGNYNHATNSKDNLEYVDFDNLKDYLEFKIDLLNNRYDAINAENDKDFVDRLHLKSSGINKKGFDYSTNYKGYLNMLLNTRSLDKWLKLLYTPVITRQDNL